MNIIREFTNEEIGSGRTALNGRYDWHGMRLGRGEIGGNQCACTSLSDSKRSTPSSCL